MAAELLSGSLPAWVRPETILFSLFGTYADETGWLPVRVIVASVAALGISEAAVRMTVSRLKKRGRVLSERREDGSGYRLTDAGARAVTTGAAKLDPVAHADRSSRSWDGLWTFILFTVPESERRLRDELRARLQELRCGTLGPGAYICPRPLSPAELGIADGAAFTERVTIVRGSPALPDTHSTLVTRAWPELPALAERYRSFVERFAVFTRRDGHPETNRGAFVVRFQCLLEYLELAFADPSLPPDLCPPGWRGEDAPNLYRSVVQHLDAASRAFVASL